MMKMKYCSVRGSLRGQARFIRGPSSLLRQRLFNVHLHHLITSWHDLYSLGITCFNQSSLLLVTLLYSQNLTNQLPPAVPCNHLTSPFLNLLSPVITCNHLWSPLNSCDLLLLGEGGRGVQPFCFLSGRPHITSKPRAHRFFKLLV